LQEGADPRAPAGRAPAPARLRGRRDRGSHYAPNDSVFIGGDYMIKAFPERILWKLLTTRECSGRCDFTNRELRMARELRLPEIADNLEARLILSAAPLAERCPQLAIEKTGRGQIPARGRLCAEARRPRLTRRRSRRQHAARAFPQQ
jgi:hypothetical protein